ncbi:MAG: gas vesicle protein K [Clostridiales bacterium]|jgi:hypothetical protein|nr:gas vesicle protein K [Eubacteriales bacterium]MDH7566565.1 gas vesicle protein K [Clostridiales bacterium]
MALDINEDNLKHGLLGLIMALVEIIRDALKHQARERIKSGVLTGEEIERLGNALMELDLAIEEIKEEQGITESVKGVRELQWSQPGVPKRRLTTCWIESWIRESC